MLSHLGQLVSFESIFSFGSIFVSFRLIVIWFKEIVSFDSLVPFSNNSFSPSRAQWKMKELPFSSSSSPSSTSGSLYARFELDDGPSTPSPVGVQFFVDGALLSGIDLQLQGNGGFISYSVARSMSVCLSVCLSVSICLSVGLIFFACLYDFLSVFLWRIDGRIC